MTSWPRTEVLAACNQYASLLSPIPDINLAYLLAALAMNESSLGADCGPRHESDWDLGGMYARDPEQTKLLEQFPYAAACSYGPLQIMYYNASGYMPTELDTNLSLVMRASVGYLSRQILRFNLSTLDSIGEMWNWGHPDRPEELVPAGVQNYCKDLALNYAKAPIWLKGI